MLNISRFSTLFILLNLALIPAFAEENPEIKIFVSGKLQKNITLKDMKDNLKQHTITFFDPQYSKEKNYKAFKLKDFLNMAYGNEWMSSDYTDISFKAYDGYDSISVTSNLKQDGAYLVFKDLDYEDWEPVSYTKAYPGPFYIVWVNKNQTTKNGYPWPWQLASMNLITFAEQFPEVVPKVADKNSTVYKGFELFKTRCVRCHAINREGGTLGPDLNAPRNILEYRPVDVVKEFIRNTSKFRFSHMPDHKDLSEEDLDNLIDYFYYNLKENSWSFEESN